MNEEKVFEKITGAHDLLSAEIGKVIIGQSEVVTQLLTALFAGGHCILVGVPGLAKTLLVSTVAKCLNLEFSRIQFTPDLMPSDIMGTEVLEEDRTTGNRVFKFIRGPVFANIVLADEINRTPPKTQAALLQAMQELEVTVGGKTRPLDRPFFVLATRNPIELEGTYPLPEAQLDRFMYDIRVDYPDEREELEIVERTTSADLPGTETVLDGEDILEIREAVKKVPVSRDVLHYAVSLVRMTREKKRELGKYLSWGAGPRAGQYLILAAKTRAVMLGRTTPEIMDVREVAHPVLRHRLVTNFHAEADGVSTDELIDRLMEAVSAGKV